MHLDRAALYIINSQVLLFTETSFAVGTYFNRTATYMTLVRATFSIFQVGKKILLQTYEFPSFFCPLIYIRRKTSRHFKDTTNCKA